MCETERERERVRKGEHVRVCGRRTLRDKSARERVRETYTLREQVCVCEVHTERRERDKSVTNVGERERERHTSRSSGSPGLAQGRSYEPSGE